MCPIKLKCENQPGMFFSNAFFCCWFWLEVVVEALDLFIQLELLPFLDSSIFGSHFPKSDHAVCEIKPGLLTSRLLIRLKRKPADKLFIYFLPFSYTLSPARKMFLKNYKFKRLYRRCWRWFLFVSCQLPFRSNCFYCLWMLRTRILVLHILCC